MLKTLILTIFLCLAGSLAQSTETSNFSTLAVHYTCDRNVNLEVIYLNLESGESFATMNFDGKLMLMQQIITASGAAYGASDQSGYTLYTKGNTGFINYSPADSDEITLLNNCVEVSN